MRTLLILTLTLISSTALAQGSQRCNDFGAVVTLNTGETYYLGKDCDASLVGVGEGRWWLTASAYAVEINGLARLLPVEPACELPACWAEQ